MNVTGISTSSIKNQLHCGFHVEQDLKLFCESAVDIKLNHTLLTFIMLLYSLSPIFFCSIYIQDPPHLFLFKHLRSFYLKSRTASLFSLQFFQVKHLTSHIQSACKFNQIIQLCFTLQKLRHKSTPVNLGTMEALDKSLMQTNGKTLSTCVCSNALQFLLNLIPLIMSILFSTQGTTYKSLEFLPTFTKLLFFFQCDLCVQSSLH